MCGHAREDFFHLTPGLSVGAAKKGEFFHLAARFARCVAAQALHGVEVEPGARVHEMPFREAEKNAVDGERGLRHADQHALFRRGPGQASS